MEKTQFKNHTQVHQFRKETLTIINGARRKWIKIIQKNKILFGLRNDLMNFEMFPFIICVRKLIIIFIKNKKKFKNRQFVRLNHKCLMSLLDDIRTTTSDVAPILPSSDSYMK